MSKDQNFLEVSYLLHWCTPLQVWRSLSHRLIDSSLLLAHVWQLVRVRSLLRRRLRKVSGWVIAGKPELRRGCQTLLWHRWLRSKSNCTCSKEVESWRHDSLLIWTSEALACGSQISGRSGNKLQTAKLPRSTHVMMNHGRTGPLVATIIDQGYPMPSSYNVGQYKVHDHKSKSVATLSQGIQTAQTKPY